MVITNTFVISIILFANIASISSLKQLRFNFTGFDEGRNHFSFQFSGNSSIDGGALQLTPDTTNDGLDFGFRNESGRIFYHQPFKLWSSPSNINDKVQTDIASFNSTFLMNIYRKSTWDAGEGFAFLIAPDKYYLPDQSAGQWLGLTNETTDGHKENQFVAIEFDTEEQEFDPDDNHIGLNINSIRSNKTVSLRDYDIEISPQDMRDMGVKYRVWVQYNGKLKIIEVYMARENESKPDKPVLNETIDLSNFVKRDSYFGFAASTGDPEIQLNCVLAWSLEIDEIKDEKDLRWLKIAAGVGIPVLLVLVLCGVRLSYVYRKKKKRRRIDGEEVDVVGTLKRLPGMPREFKYKELKKATKNFDPSMVLGKGGFGVVYKGTLRENINNTSNDRNTNIVTDQVAEVAVKIFSRNSIKEGIDDFLAELTIIHRLRHKHLVRLVGWCYEKKKLLLVYDFMPNGSLEKHLYNNHNPTLNWRHRCKILEGVASALHYIHNEYDQKVLHRDLKASNIMLDSDFNARLGDFGLARALDPERNSYADIRLGGVPGTVGYVAPECFHTGRATPESDVFGFGAVVLEVVCGRTPWVGVPHGENVYTLVDWVWMLHREGRIEEAVDQRLRSSNVAIDEAKRLLLLGLACSHPTASERPETKAILQIVSGNKEAPKVPHFKPVFTWPSLAFDEIRDSNSDSALSSVVVSSS